MNIVTKDYQGQLVAFNDGGWINATAEAAKWGKVPVIYCIRFKNGLCKVGMTKCLSRRVVELSGHGLWKDMFIEVLAVEAGDKHLGSTEAVALKLFCETAKQKGQEVFTDPGSNVALSLLEKAAQETKRVNQEKPHETNADFEQIAKQSGIWDALVWLAKEKRMEQTVNETVTYALDCLEGKSDAEIDAMVEDLHPFCLELVPIFVARNAVFIGMGLSYEQRKGALKAEAMDWCIKSTALAATDKAGA